MGGQGERRGQWNRRQGSGHNSQRPACVLCVGDTMRTGVQQVEGRTNAEAYDKDQRDEKTKRRAKHSWDAEDAAASFIIMLASLLEHLICPRG